GPVRGVRAGAGPEPDRYGGQLLRSGRAFAAGDAAGVADQVGAGGGGADPCGVRAPDRGGARRGTGRCGSRAGAADPGSGAAGSAAVVVRAAAAVVPGTAVRPQYRVQPAVRLAAARRA